MSWKDALPGNLIGEGRNLLDDFAEIAGQGPAEFVSSGQPKSINGKVAQAAQRSVCQSWARGNENFSPWQSDYTAAICEPYLKSIGEWPGAPAVGAPVNGGQCNFFYVMQVNTTFTNAIGETVNANSGEIVVRGPIQGAVITRIGGIINPGDFGPTEAAIAGVRGADGVVGAAGFSPPGGNNPRNPVIVNLRPQNPANVDNCGNADGPYQPPIGPTLPPKPPLPPKTPFDFPDIDIDVEFNPDGTIDVDIDGRREPYVGPDPSSDGGDETPPLNPGDQGEPGDAGDTGDGGEEEGSDPNRVLVGVRVDLTTIAPRARTTFRGDRPFFWYPYSVEMGGDAALEVDSESTFAPDTAFYHAPENANRYRVSMAPGFRAIVTPYWRDVEE